MNNEPQITTLSFQLLDKTWQIRCPEQQVQDLQKCAVQLDSKMREIATNSKIIGPERIAVMAAINAIYDLMAQQNQKDLYIESLSSHIRELKSQLAKAKEQQN